MSNDAAIGRFGRPPGAILCVLALASCGGASPGPEPTPSPPSAVAATRTAARTCGRESDLGVLAAGKIADVLVVDGDPLADLSALARPRVVVHDGVVIRGGS
jgi:cytosine/adenosine deaminase-related metal-dependent hydrolase